MREDTNFKGSNLSGGYVTNPYSVKLLYMLKIATGYTMHSRNNLFEAGLSSTSQFLWKIMFAQHTEVTQKR
jgi:hypothetical protein